MDEVPSERDLLKFKGYAVQGIDGADREDAINRAWGFIDAHSKGKRTVAAERYRVTRVSRLSLGWWAVRYELA